MADRTFIPTGRLVLKIGGPEGIGSGVLEVLDGTYGFLIVELTYQGTLGDPSQWRPPLAEGGSGSRSMYPVYDAPTRPGATGMFGRGDGLV